MYPTKLTPKDPKWLLYLSSINAGDPGLTILVAIVTWAGIPVTRRCAGCVNLLKMHLCPNRHHMLTCRCIRPGFPSCLGTQHKFVMCHVCDDKFMTV